VRRTHGGFTLIELMVVVAIVGILAGIAYPSYRDRVLRSARAEGRAALLDAAARQEQYFLDNKTYTTTLSDLQVATATETGKYSLTVDGATADCALTTCYVLRATPEGGQAEDLACAELTLDSNGTKSASGTEPTTCW